MSLERFPFKIDSKIFSLIFCWINHSADTIADELCMFQMYLTLIGFTVVQLAFIKKKRSGK